MLELLIGFMILMFGAYILQLAIAGSNAAELAHKLLTQDVEREFKLYRTVCYILSATVLGGPVVLYGLEQISIKYASEIEQLKKNLRQLI